MKILVSGSSGLIGKALDSRLKSEGHDVKRLVRHPAREGDEVYWSPSEGKIDKDKLNEIDGIFHFSGENIASGRWTQSKKDEIYNSRVISTRFLADTISSLLNPPRFLITASAVGFYGSQKDEMLTEAHQTGSGFLARVCRDWEASAEKVRMKGVRLVQARFGVVLSPKGGALRKMLLPFKLGLGGRLGPGTQYMSWISLEEAVQALLALMSNDDLRGPVNIVSPNPVTNNEFTKALGRVLKRPTLFPMPAFVVEILFGEMGREILLGSQRALPKKLEDSGFKFKFSDLEKALRALI